MDANDKFFDRLVRADELGVRLEIVGGLPIWEASPVLRHQKAVDRIRSSITPIDEQKIGCGCHHYADVYVGFPDGSLMRPDIAIFCNEPEEEESAIRQIPEAVIEVISKGYEAKDLEIAPRVYLSQGVQDVVVLDPHTLVVLHITKTGATRHISPVALNLECGCQCVV